MGVTAGYSFHDTRWPPDDTEESVVGTDRHQITMYNLRLGINEIAHVTAGAEIPLPWQALTQTMLTGFSRPDGSRYITLPDVFAYRRPMARDRGSLSILVEGPPALIVEVASESTHERDLDVTAGKAWSYAHASVGEYLVIDPIGLFLSVPARAWRLVEGQFQVWEPNGDGVWWSEQIPVGFGVADESALVFDSMGQPQLREGEVTAALTRERAMLASERAERERQEAENAELRRRLEELDNR